MSRVKVFFDGGCRPNPGGMLEIAVVASGRTVILDQVGHGTSMDAEWLALIHAFALAQSLDLPDFILLGDAADVVAKAKGAIRCRGAELGYLERFRQLVASPQLPRMRYIKRSQNLAGIALAKRHPR